MDTLFDEYESVMLDEEDIRWGLAIPAKWMPRKRYGMTDKQKELYARCRERRNNKGESK